MKPDIRFPQIQGYDLKNKENVKILADMHGMLGVENLLGVYTEYGITFQLVEKYTIASEDNQLLGIQTRSRKIHTTSLIVPNNSSELDINLYTGVTFSDDGSLLTVRGNNFNEDNIDDLEVEFYEDVVIDTSEDEYLIDTSYGEQGIGGRKVGVPWSNNIRSILEPNSNYVIELDNIDTDECNVTIGLGFVVPELLE